MSLNCVYVVDVVRTPVGKYGGSLGLIRPDDLAAIALKSLMERNISMDFSILDEVIFGAANQAGEDNRNVARMALLLAGIPASVPGYTVNRLCASGLQSIMNAFTAIRSGTADAIIAGGTESMTRAPFVMAKSETAFGRNTEVYDTTIGWRFTNKTLSDMYYPYSMGETAENVADNWKITREAQDIFAYNSQKKYEIAKANGVFKEEICAVNIHKPKGEVLVFDKDEHPRLSSLEALSLLKPAFVKNGTVTAGNASGINDGAAAMLIVSEKIVKQFNLKPIAKIIAIGTAGVEPKFMGIGPVPATKKALSFAGLKVKDLDLIELNEAFASQALACMQELDLDSSIVNVNGGSIAIGHPLGASGTRISATLLHELQKNKNAKYSLATMCIGVGQGSAIIYEKV